MGRARGRRGGGGDGRILQGTRVRDIRADGRTGFVMEMDHEDFEADRVVLAVGAWARTVGARLGIDVPVTPLRLCNAVLELPGGVPATAPTVLDLPNHLYFRPEGGPLLVGDGEGFEDIDPDGFDESLPYSFVEEVSGRIVRRFPRCAEASYTKGWRGLDGASPDYRPIVGPVAEKEGPFLCAGMSGHGFKLAPAIGRGVAELLPKGRYETIDLMPYAPDRFAKGRALSSLFSMKIAA